LVELLGVPDAEAAEDAPIGERVAVVELEDLDRGFYLAGEEVGLLGIGG
jgi:hypothetical protein